MAIFFNVEIWRIDKQKKKAFSHSEKNLADSLNLARKKDYF